MKFAICRIIGNELPPRDQHGGKLKSLAYILNHREPADLIWILNHLHDSEYRERVIDELRRHKQNFHELRFDSKYYSRLKTFRERLCYAVNVNHARNVAVRMAWKHHEFAVCLDQDCFLTLDLWFQVIDFIQHDQSTCPGRRYYGLMMKRVMGFQDANPSRLCDQEPQLIFRRDAPCLFDSGLPFGEGEKAALVHWLGFGPPPQFVLNGDLCRVAGSVLHLQAGSSVAEADLRTRMWLRRLSVHRLLRKLNSECG